MKIVSILSLTAFMAVQSSLQNQIKSAAKFLGPIPQEILDVITACKDQNPNKDLLPKGILLYAKPGNGKSEVGKIIKKELGDSCIVKSACQLAEETDVKKLFKKAREVADASLSKKAVIFIDDFQIFGKQSDGADIETRDNLIALENELDGFDNDNDAITVIGATYSKKFYDTLTRSGRFDTTAELLSLTPEERLALLKQFAQEKGLTIDPNLKLQIVSGNLLDFSPADLKKIVHIAQKIAKADKCKTLTENHILQAALDILKIKAQSNASYLVKVKTLTSVLKKQTLPSGFACIIGNIPKEIKDLVEQIKDDSKFKKFNLELPKGILFTGPPGTGKTSLARAISQEAGCEFIATTGEDYIQSLVGSGSDKIKELFESARQKAKQSRLGKTIIFFDEIDALGKRQGNTMDSTITALLTEMDGFEADDSVIVLAACNNPENLDSALLRAGRFSKTIRIGLPDESTRKDIIKYYIGNIPLDSTTNLDKIAKATSNFSPAELKELVKRSSTLAMNEQRSNLQEKYFVQSIKSMLTEKLYKGDTDVKTQISALDVVFNGATSTQGFNQIAGGVEEPIQDLVKMLNGDYDYAKYKVPFPKGILLVGPPGTGKSLLAKALAEESGCEFVEAKGSEFANKYVGVGAASVRELFNKARKKAEGNRHGKTIIFIDELDAVGSRTVADNSETRQIITELLTQMDGANKDESIIVLGACNDPSSLDSALVRAGRFDEIIELSLPDAAKRQALFEFYAKGRPVAADVSFEKLAKLVDECNAADIKNIIDRASKIAMKNKSASISMAEFDQAINQAIENDNLRETSYINNKSDSLSTEELIKLIKKIENKN